ncbi:MAG: transporter substrate-binding domain-containing protein [Candidatus Babeliales bacterium]|nr:transporter substrate-binding domain-containing protein [Candidatus Babeliales bacterium]
MKNKSLIIAASLFIGVTALFYYKSKHAPLPDMQEVILVGTNAEFPPFTFIDEQRNIVGFDIDIATEVVKTLGKKMKLKDLSFDMLIPEAQTGSIQIIAAGITPTLERANHLIFTKPYLSGESLIVVTLNKNPITSINDLQGKEVVVNEGYISDNYASSLAGVRVKRLPAPAESMLDLQMEKTFAYITTRNAVEPFMQKSGTDKFNIFIIPGQYESTAMGISKHYPELLNEIQPILDRMERDGTIEMLKKKWNLL